MAKISCNTLKLLIIVCLGSVQLNIGYFHLQQAYYLASAELSTSNDKPNSNSLLNQNRSSDSIEQLCADCRLTSESIDDLLKQPRQMDAYGSMGDRVDLDKIKKGVCKDIVNDSLRERCRNFYFTHATNTLQAWKQSNSRISFFDFACIKELKFCCPRNSFGPRCTKCPTCNQNQQCQGEGTRLGEGVCECRKGHTGPSCSSCLPGFYSDQDNYRQPTQNENSNQTQKLTCKVCHKSCLYCRSEGPLGCEVCQKGFAWVPTYGCSDIDECIKSNNKICGENTFCVNTEGSYFCYECDRACNGCNGDGPDMCLRCAKGYKLDKGNCVALKKTLIPPEANYYSLIGLAVALYIGFCEYVMSTHKDEMLSLD